MWSPRWSRERVLKHACVSPSKTYMQCVTAQEHLYVVETHIFHGCLFRSCLLLALPQQGQRPLLGRQSSRNILGALLPCSDRDPLCLTR